MKRGIFLLLMSVCLMPSAFAQKTNKLTKSEIKNGWILLFDGESTKGWTTTSGAAVPSGWHVANGVLTSVADGKGGDIVTSDEFTNFELRLEYISVALTKHVLGKLFVGWRQITCGKKFSEC